MVQKTDDRSIPGPVEVYRRIQSKYVDFDTKGDPVISGGAFRTEELSVYRCDRVTEDEVLIGYPDDGLAKTTVEEMRKAGLAVVADEPPLGHLRAYRADSPGKRISGGAAASMARAATLVRLPKRL